ncbi:MULTISPECIES: TlpA disulfide reductase family protein [Rhodococcus]|uniref:Thioredoxin n=1 Tax=Rhodococcoides kyotonense TaxID=398843 RepID=A0A177YEQ1_9NOCA|nr:MULTISPECIES: TlpA disulfide reductase family protein [Rhodococcus]NIL75244.1 Thiol-disulfide oxidoreductase ResA [Rhodococcus sp. B10]OAK53921.1 thioredoxin [Rhodococcus kyotonensis]
MNASAGRWSLAALVVVAALVFAIWPRGNDEPTTTTGPGQGAPISEERRDADTAQALAPLRERAALDACPTPSAGAVSSGPLAGVELECIGDGSRVDLGAALAGKPALINLWAYWCGPCKEELPHLQEYADSVADELTVLTVHQDRNEANGLTKLADYGVRLPGVQDGAGRIAAAVGAPSVLPVSILVDADGNVARVLPQPFRSVDEIDEAVRTDLGIAR